MGSKKGHRQFKSLRHAIFNGPEKFQGYPHRRHRKDRPMFKNSEISQIRNAAHIEDLEEELGELI